MAFGSVVEVTGSRHDVKCAVLLDDGTPVSNDKSLRRYYAIGEVDDSDHGLPKLIKFEVYSDEIGDYIAIMDIDEVARLRKAEENRERIPLMCFRAYAPEVQ